MKKSNLASSTSFRKKAEEILQSRLLTETAGLNETDPSQLIHELQVHQIELELQNEELRLANERAQLAAQKYTELYDFAPTGYFTLSKTGKIIEANRLGALLLGKKPPDLLNSQFGFYVTEESKPVFNHFLDQVFNSKINESCEIDLITNDDSTLFVHIDSIVPENNEQCFLSVTDNSKDKQKIGLLEQNEKRILALVENIHDMVTIIDPEGKVIYTSSAVEKITGFTLKELQDMPGFALIHPDELEATMKSMHEVLHKPAIPIQRTNRLLHKDGHWIWGEGVVINLLNDPNVNAIITSYKEITKRKQAEDTLKISEERFRTTLYNMLEGCQIIGFDWKYIYLNQAAEIQNKRPNEELLGNRYMDMWPGIEKTTVFKFIKQALEERVSTHSENEFLFPDGSIGWFDLSIQPVPEGVFILSIDITERKNAENDFRESESRFRKIYEDGPLGMAIINSEFRYEKVNSIYSIILGYTEQELQNLSFRDLTYPNDLINDMPEIQKLMNQEISVYKTEKRYIRKDGRIIWGSLTLTSNFSNDGQFLYNLAILEDITPRKQTEEDLKKSKKLLSETESIGRVGGWEFNMDTLEQTWTDEVYRIHEVDFDFNPNVDKGINFYAPDSRPIVEKAVQNALQFGKSFDLELEIITAKGNLRKVHSIGNVDLENRRVYGFYQDITERKRAEEELRTSEAKFRAVAELSPIAIYASSGSDQKAIYTNEAFYNIFGFSMEDVPTVGHWWIKAFPDENYRQQVIDQWTYNIEQAAINHLDVEALECVCTCNDGTEKIIVWVGKTIADEFWAFGYDITERKQSEEKIRELNERISTATHASQLGIWDWDVVNNRLAWDDQMYTLYGLKHGEFPGAYEAWLNGVHPDDREFSNTISQQAIRGEKDYDTEFRIVWPDNSVHWLKASGQVFFDENGTPVRMIGVNFDITKQKKAEEELLASKLKLDTALASMTDAIFISDADGRFIEFNDAFATFHKFKNKDECAKTFAEYPEFLDVYMANGELARIDQWAVPRALSGEVVKNAEYTLHRRDTGETWVGSYSFSPIRDNDGKIIGSVVAGRDITESKQAETALRDEKDRIRTILDLVGDPIFVKDNEHRITLANRAFYEIFGMDEKSVIGYTLVEAVPENERHHFLKVDRSVLDTGIPDQREEELTVADITRTIITRKIRFIDESGNIYLVGTIHDITERKKAEETLHENNSRLELAMQSANMAWWEMDIKTGKVTFDPRKAEMLGYPPERFKHYTDFTALLHSEDFDKAMNAMQRHIDGLVDKYEIEYRIKTQSGEYKWFYDIGTINRDAEGTPLNIIGLVIDISWRKQAEEALNRSEERYRNIVESAVIGIYRTTPDGKIILANQTLIKMLGFDSFEELAQRNLEKEGYEDEGERRKFRESIEKDGTVIGLESVWKTKNGQSVFVSENAKAFYDSDGKIIYYEGTIEDITKRKLVENALRDSEALLREVGRIAMVGGWDFNPLTGQSTCTEQVALIHDLDPKTSASVSLSINYYTEHSKPIIEKAFRKVLKRAIPYDLELEIVTAKNNHKWVRTIGHPVIENGKVVRVFGSFQDVTERKLVEEALRESEEKFRLLIENLPLPVALTTHDGVISFRNTRFVEVFGFSEEDVPTLSEWWIKAYPDEQYRQLVRNKWDERAKKAIGTGLDIESNELMVTCKDGTERYIIISGISIRDNFLVTFIDITDRKKSEKEIMKLNETLEQRVDERTMQLLEANKELESFSYSVSHDLRAPLRHINGFVELLDEKYQDLLPEQGKHYLETIVNASNQMGNLIDDLLQFSRTGRQEMRRTELDMNLVLRESIELLKPDMTDRTINWEIIELPHVTGDHALLRIVWFNLLHNAVKYTRKKENSVIQIGFKDEEKQYVFFIRDNGAGFDMRYSSKLFGVFQRLHSKSEFEGTGIGLANVRRIILKHGGQTWAESRLNEGATFYFTLPKS